MKQNKDDIGFINVLIDELIDKYPVDPNKIFITGASNGGVMAHRIGIELSHKVAGIAPVVSGLFGDEPMPTSPVPAIIINGFQDKSFPMKGGEPGGDFAHTWSGEHLQPVKYQGEFWAKNNRCRLKPNIKRINENVYYWEYKNCSQNSPVKHYIVKDNGHAWPGGQTGRSVADPPSNALNATDTIWEFFSSI